MKPSEPPADPIVATMTISVAVILVFDRKNTAKKNSAAIVGPSSITPNDSERYEFIAHRMIANTSPATSARIVIGVGLASSDIHRGASHGDAMACQASADPTLSVADPSRG